MDRHQFVLVQAAKRLGVAVRDLSDAWGHDVVAFEHGGRVAVVRSGRVFPGLSSHSEFLCQEKHVCKAVLREIGIPVPSGIQLRDLATSREPVAALLATSAPLVLKPSASEGGDGVHVGLRDVEAVEAALRDQAQAHGRFVLEEQVAGQDLRIHVIDGEIVAACLREPAFVRGDGTSTIEALVAARREVMRTQNPDNRLDLDGGSDQLLREQGFTRDAVPGAGHKVVLESVGNLALGGVASDVTDGLHPTYATWARLVAERFTLRVFAIDVLAAMPGADPEEAAKVIEINAKPDWLHHTFSEGRTHDMARLLLRHLFGDAVGAAP